MLISLYGKVNYKIKQIVFSIPEGRFQYPVRIRLQITFQNFFKIKTSGKS
jgi:hypothetical protein